MIESILVLFVGIVEILLLFLFVFVCIWASDPNSYQIKSLLQKCYSFANFVCLFYLFKIFFFLKYKKAHAQTNHPELNQLPQDPLVQFGGLHFISFGAGVHKTGDLNLVRNSPPYPNQTEPTSPLVIRYLFTDLTHDV